MIAKQHLYLLFGPTPLPRRFAYHSRNHPPLNHHQLPREHRSQHPQQARSKDMRPRTPSPKPPLLSNLASWYSDHWNRRVPTRMVHRQLQNLLPIFPFRSQLVYEILQSCVLEKVEINVGCRSMSVVVDFFQVIVAGNNVVLGTLVRAYIIAFLHWNQSLEDGQGGIKY